MSTNIYICNMYQVLSQNYHFIVVVYFPAAQDVLMVSDKDKCKFYYS